MNGHFSSQNNSYWCSINLCLIQEVPLRDAKVGMWYTMNKLLGPYFILKQIISYICETNINRIILTEEESAYTWFQKESVSAHTTDDPFVTLEGMFGDNNKSWFIVRLFA
jgi:hypothetical protein